MHAKLEEIIRINKAKQLPVNDFFNKYSTCQTQAGWGNCEGPKRKLQAEITLITGKTQGLWIFQHSPS